MLTVHWGSHSNEGSSESDRQVTACPTAISEKAVVRASRSWGHSYSQLRDDGPLGIGIV